MKIMIEIAMEWISNSKCYNIYHQYMDNFTDYSSSFFWVFESDDLNGKLGDDFPFEEYSYKSIQLKNWVNVTK